MQNKTFNVYIILLLGVEHTGLIQSLIGDKEGLIFIRLEHFKSIARSPPPYNIDNSQIDRPCNDGH